jgi:orotate phosphoribosyltransferase
MNLTDEALGRDLVAAAVLRGDFLLRSGARSSYYIDKYLFTTQPELLRRIAVELASRLPAGVGRLASRLPEGVQRLAGPVLGAVPLVTALSLETRLPMLIVRVEKPKEYGTAKQIEGTLMAGERVVLVEDVVTTAGAALAAVDVLRAAGAEVLGALVVVDREQGGAEAFAAAGVPYQALFTTSSLGL